VTDFNLPFVLREIIGDSRHVNIIEGKKTSKAIIFNYFGARIRKKVIGFPFVDVKTNSSDVTAFQGTFVFGLEMHIMS
jgi:hypothetical protein